MSTGNFASGVFRSLEAFFQKLLNSLGALAKRDKRAFNLSEKIFLFDNDELLLVWESGLREKRLKMEEEAWQRFEAQFGKKSPRITEAFLAWQEQLYAYIEQEKDRFLKEREGSKKALGELIRQGAKTIVVTKGAKPYTQKCFNLTGLSPFISDIYSPAPGSRAKRFSDAVYDMGKGAPWKWVKDTLIVGHDPDKDMAWDLAPSKGASNDGNAPVLVLFDALAFDRNVDAPLDALLEITQRLLELGEDDFLRGFKAIKTPHQARTPNYVFQVALYSHPKKSDKARIPVIHSIRKVR